MFGFFSLLKTNKTRNSEENLTETGLPTSFSCGTSQRDKGNKGSAYIVIGCVPISGKKPEVAVRGSERDRDARTTPDTDGSKGTSGFMEGKRREIVKATNLVFDLNYVGEVFAWWNWTCCPNYSILPWVLPLLHTVPAKGTR